MVAAYLMQVGKFSFAIDSLQTLLEGLCLQLQTVLVMVLFFTKGMTPGLCTPGTLLAGSGTIGDTGEKT